MERIMNPYLPLTEHVPDGEPHVFDGRVYIYGSHDRAGGTRYCEDHYVTWSAPVEDLSDWRCEGVIYRRTQDPSNADDKMQLWAPDVTKGPDGRYYLYYCFSFYPEIGVAVSDSPAGPFEFCGHVHYRDGAILKEFMPFDPAVLTDLDGRVYLYYGFCPAAEKEMKMPDLTEEEKAALPERARERMERFSKIRFGEDSMVVELESDMLTAKETPRPLIPGGHHTAGTGFEGHGFFEASSIRRFGDTYYFVYSSHKSHELCYATSRFPDRDFVYGGIVVSNGDIGLNGEKKPVYTIGNNHGGLEKIGDDYYIFYHRQTNGTEFSRQGMAEKVEIREDGSIAQVEITTSGLYGKALPASGVYPAAVCCHLTSPTTMDSIDYSNPVMQKQTRIVQRADDVYVADVADGTVLGYKYFAFEKGTRLAIEVRGSFSGDVICGCAPSGGSVTQVSLKADDWTMAVLAEAFPEGDAPLYLSFKGEGSLAVRSLVFLPQA